MFFTDKKRPMKSCNIENRDLYQAQQRYAFLRSFREYCLNSSKVYLKPIVSI